ncbi:MAG: hypothetical protein OEX19_09890 [Gammaproteobacteria bacterium]|nr:hypothetical protein [Gammaproteobacteria bacterium]
MERFIEKDELPSSLWNEEEDSLLLPPIAVSSWISLLETNSLYELAESKAPKGFEGGVSEEDTNKHLAWRYNGSCGRILLSMLDPHNKLPSVSDAYAKIFSGNKVFLADLPSGSGAAVITILTTLAELRCKSCLPRIPLTVVVVAGEISESARKYVVSQIDSIRVNLEEQAIWVEYDVVDWDVCDPINSTDLIRKMTIKSNDCDSRMLVVSNFSGLLESNGKWKDAKPQLDEIFRHSRDDNSTAIWIEPQRNNVPIFLDRLVSWFVKLFREILPAGVSREATDWYAKDDAKIKQPIKDGYYPVRLSVVRFELPIKGEE